MNSLTRIFQAGLLLLAIAPAAAAQMAMPFSDGGYAYGGKGAGGGLSGHGLGYGAGNHGGHGGYGGYGTGTAHVPWLGRTMFSLNGVVDGMGYEGSYGSASTTIPLGHDALHGWWLIDWRTSVSENGGPFTNVGLVRRTHFSPMNADFGVGVFYDMDADEYEDFGHTFHQIGVSAHMWTPHFDVNINGYIPVGTVEHTLGSPDNGFIQNSILLQHGLDAALEGWDADFGIRPPGWQQKNGTINLGVYAYRGESIDPFAGFQGSYSFQPRPGMRLVFGMTADEEFDPSGVFQLELWRGRSRGHSPSGRGLDPMRRRAHIVRQHQDPVFATNPETGALWRVVHVDNTDTSPDGVPGAGTFENPYNTLAMADGSVNPGNSLANDIIFVRDGDGTTNGYDEGITLLTRQRLFGDGELTQIIPTVEFGPFNFASYTDDDGLNPQISNPGGDAVAVAPGATDVIVDGIDIVGAGTLRGIHLASVGDGPFGGSSFNNVDVTGVINGVVIDTASTGTFDFGPNFNINNTTGVALDLNGGSQTVTYRGDISNTVASGDAIRIRNTLAASSFTLAGGSVTDNLGTGITIDDNDGLVELFSPIDLTNVSDAVGLNITDGMGAASIVRVTNIDVDGASIGMNVANNLGGAIVSILGGGVTNSDTGVVATNTSNFTLMDVTIDSPTNIGVQVGITGGNSMTALLDGNVVSAAGDDAVLVSASGGGMLDISILNNQLDATNQAIDATLVDGTTNGTILRINASGNGVVAGDFVWTDIEGGGNFDDPHADTTDVSNDNGGVTVTDTNGNVDFGGGTPGQPAP